MLLRQRLQTLLEAMPAAQAGDVRSVHQARVATRRLREALPVLRASLDASALNRARLQVREMTRALGPVRELDVALQHLDEFANRGLLSERAVARVRDIIVKERAARREKMLETITPGKVEKLRHRLTSVGSGPAVAGKPGAVAEATRHVARRGRRLAEAIEKAGAIYVPERLHAIRVATKKLRYAMEIERELKRSRATARIRQLRTLQDLLGRMHDLEMLAQRTREIQAHTTATDRRLATHMNTLLNAIEEDCRQLHALYMRRRPSLLRLCSTIASDEETATSAVA